MFSKSKKCRKWCYLFLLKINTLINYKSLHNCNHCNAGNSVPADIMGIINYARTHTCTHTQTQRAQNNDTRHFFFMSHHEIVHPNQPTMMLGCNVLYCTCSTSTCGGIGLHQCNTIITCIREGATGPAPEKPLGHVHVSSEDFPQERNKCSLTWKGPPGLLHLNLWYHQVVVLQHV